MDGDISERWRRFGPPVPISQLRPGGRYHVVVDDCCVQAEFVSRFVRWEAGPHGEGGASEPTDAGTARFADGTRLRNLVWFAYPVDDGTDQQGATAATS